MRLWRLSGLAYANRFDGGYGLQFDGRWNRVGRPATYAATSPSLCVLEKLVHVEDPALLPELAMIAYDVPNDIPADRRSLADLPADWIRHETMTQQIGEEWLRRSNAALLFVPSAIVPIADSPDENVLINHRHPAASTIVITASQPFALDVRLF